MILLDGKKVSNHLLDVIKDKIINLDKKPVLAVLLVGDDEPSKIYVKNKIKSCEKVGIIPKLYVLPSTTSEAEIIDIIKENNEDDNVNGILVQSPLPVHIDFNKCIAYISSIKDVDGLSLSNVYNNYMNEKPVLPCTVKGILELLNFYDINVTGKNVTIIGKGYLVGKPLSIALMNKGATVTVCHSKTKDLKQMCLTADIIVSAAGVTHLVKENMVRENAVVIDVGISRVNGKLTGDVDFENVKEKCAYITPVPGGIGPMTVAMVINNTYEAYERMKYNG